MIQQIKQSIVKCLHDTDSGDKKIEYGIGVWHTYAIGQDGDYL